MKLIATALLGAGLILAQNPVAQSSDSTTVTKSKHHGKKTKTDSTNTTSTMDDQGNVSNHTSTTHTKTKRHHGKVKSSTTTSESGSTSHQ